MYTYECFACMFVCLLYGYYAHGGQKRAFLGPELKITVSHYVGAENRIWVRFTANADSALNHLARPIVHSEPTKRTQNYLISLTLIICAKIHRAMTQISLWGIMYL